MKDILVARQPGACSQQFAWSNVLLAFDYDGTLAPIVRDPDKAAMRATTRRLLRAGRRTLSLRRRSPAAPRPTRGAGCAGSGCAQVVGNHGIEPWQAHAALL